jgi:hypothetical protein
VLNGRAAIRAYRHVTMYVLGGIGFARLSRTAQFTFSSRTSRMDQSGGRRRRDPHVGDGRRLRRPRQAAAMFTRYRLEIPVARHWAVDAATASPHRRGRASEHWARPSDSDTASSRVSASAAL